MRRNKRLSAKKSKQTKLEVDALVDEIVGKLNDVRVVDVLLRRLKAVRNDVAQKQIDSFPAGTPVTFINEAGVPCIGIVISFEEALSNYNYSGRRVAQSVTTQYYLGDIWARHSNSGKLKTKVIVYVHAENVYHAVEVTELYDASAGSMQYL